MRIDEKWMRRQGSVTAVCALVLAGLAGSCVTEPCTMANGSVYVVLFDHEITHRDFVAMESVGSCVERQVTIVRLMQIRTRASLETLRALPGVRAVQNHGSDSDPARSVFVYTRGPVSNGDTAFVRSRGVTGFIGILPPDGIAFVMRVSLMEGLGGYARFRSIEIGLDDNGF